MENFQDRGVWIRIRIRFVLRGWIRIRFVLRSWIRIRSISDRIRNLGCRCDRNIGQDYIGEGGRKWEQRLVREMRSHLKRINAKWLVIL